MPTPEKPKRDDWMTPVDNAGMGRWRRRRSARERSREETLKDWYGEDLAAYEVESRQKPEQPVGDLVDNLLQSWNMADRIVLRKLIDRWEEVVGPAFVRHTTPAAIYDGKLVVEVFNAVVLHRIRPAAEEVLSKVKTIAGSEVSAIQFTAGGRSASRLENR